MSTVCIKVESLCCLFSGFWQMRNAKYRSALHFTEWFHCPKYPPGFHLLMCSLHQNSWQTLIFPVSIVLPVPEGQYSWIHRAWRFFRLVSFPSREIPLRFFRVAFAIWQLMSFVTEWYPWCGCNRSLLIHLLTQGHPGGFHFVVMVNKNAINGCAQVPYVGISFQLDWMKWPGVQFLDGMGRLYLVL